MKTTTGVPGDRLSAVIDTNVLLDWLVFEDPRVARLAADIVTGRLPWLSTPAMRDEMAAVLDRGFGARWPVDTEGVWRAWDRYARMRDARGVGLAVPRCRDRDDQMFIDLAVAEAGAWLLTRDRAVLRLARPLLRYKVVVATPERWDAATSMAANAT